MPQVTVSVFALLLATLLAPLAAQAGDATYAVDAPSAVVTVGQKGKASVTISARAGWHLNDEAPITLKLAPAAGIAVDKPKLARADLASWSASAARFDVSLVASEPGKRMVEAEAGFVLCQESACRPIREKIVLAVEASAAAKAAPAKAKKGPQAGH